MMIRRGTVCVLMLFGALPGAAFAGNTVEEVTGTLRAGLKDKGRAEVQLERRQTDPLTDRIRTSRGQLAIEPPAFARLEFTPSGEQVVVRADGGEWIQPGLEQMIRVPGERLTGVLRWWRLFAGADSTLFTARRVGTRRYVVMPTGMPDDSARVQLAKSGLPYELAIDEGLETPTVYRFTGWKFTAPRGRADFVLKAPPGYEVVDLP